MLGAAAWLVLASGFLVVREVRVTGLQRLDPTTVRRVADLPAGVPLARLDTAGATRRVAALPGVASVRVERRWPHAAQILVRERTPVLAVPAPAGYRLVDASGLAFQTVRDRPPGLPVVVLAAPGPHDAATKAAVAVVRALPAAVKRRVVRVEAASPAGFVLVLTHQRTVVWGGPERSADKAAALAALVTRKALRYDVSSPDLVTLQR
jgi:cell division protein FtsQ